MMKNKVRWGVIGAGGIAKTRTIPGLLQAENAELTAVMSGSAERAEANRKLWNCPKAYSDLSAMMADPDIDAVYIATPLYLHFEETLAAAEAGKHVLLEKPLALTADEGQYLVDFCVKKGVLLGAGFMMRYSAQIRNMKKAIEEGKLGRVISSYSQFTCYLSQPDWHTRFETGGGGALMDMGIHIIDLLQYMLGCPVRQVAAINESLTFPYETEDSSSVLLRMENGCQCVIQTNFNLPEEEARWRLELFGERGCLMSEDVIGQVDGGTVSALFLEDGCGTGEKRPGTDLPAEFGNLYTAEISSFSHSILTGAPVEVPASCAISAQRVVEAAYRSWQEKKILTL